MGIEKLTTLAFSMYHNKGAYALLLGAGISRSAHIPSGWEVEERFIEQIGATQGVTGIKDWHQWYKERYDKPSEYSSLLGELVKGSTERVAMMCNFFEATKEEEDLGLKQPTKAHISIARLAKNGYIRVVITPNFDRLLERALEMEGIIPQVIYHESDIEKATPLIHSQTVTIVKINGDYKDCRFRNTTEELDSYPETLEKYLSWIFENFGLVTCGWSAKWDKGLIDIITKSSKPRYNSFFSFTGKASQEIVDLASSQNGEIMPIDSADALFTNLYEQIMALEKLQVNRNLNHEMILARTKKYLSSKQYDIDYSDLIVTLSSDAYNQIVDKAQYNFQITPEKFQEYLSIHYNAIKPLLDIAILAVRWGKSNHIAAFEDILVKLCTKPIYYGVTIEGTQHIHSLAPMLLLNTLGMACVKYERFKELDRILKLTVPSPNFYDFYRNPLLRLVGKPHWDCKTQKDITQLNVYYPFSHLLLHKLKPHFEGLFTVDSDYENIYYIWEHIKSLIYGYNNCDIVDGHHFIIGQFIRNEYKLRYKEEPYNVFFESAEKLKDNWPPIKQGMFGGKYEEYKKTFDLAEEYYRQYGNFH